VTCIARWKPIAGCERAVKLVDSAQRIPGEFEGETGVPRGGKIGPVPTVKGLRIVD